MHPKISKKLITSTSIQQSILTTTNIYISTFTCLSGGYSVSNFHPVHVRCVSCLTTKAERERTQFYVVLPWIKCGVKLCCQVPFWWILRNFCTSKVKPQFNFSMVSWFRSIGLLRLIRLGGFFNVLDSDNWG